jgi:hypothetical protein
MQTRTFIAGGAMLAVALAPSAASAKPKKPKPTKYCVPNSVGFDARGTFVSGSLSQTKGADTAKRGDDRYSGSIVVDVKKANHGAPKGEQAYTVTNARVRFHPSKDTEPSAGDRVKLSGKLTKVRGKKCANPGVSATTVRKLDIKAKKA